MIAAWRPIGRAAGLVLGVVATIYLATSKERMQDDFRARVAAVQAIAQQCLAKPVAEPDYAELVRLETRLFADNAARCGSPDTVTRGVRSNGAT